MIFRIRLLSISAAICLVFLSFLGCGAREQEGITISFLDTEYKSGAWAEVIANRTCS